MIKRVFSLHSEPCPPTNVQANVACEQLTATVSWQQSDNAVGYVAYVDNQSGHTASCVGLDTDTQCDVSGLLCGTMYSVWVKALGRPYNSSDSTVTTVTSGTDIISICLIFSPFLSFFLEFIHLFLMLLPQLHACPGRSR